MTSSDSPVSGDGTIAPVTVRVERTADAVVLAVAGEVDMATAPQVHDAVLRALEERPSVLVIDLDGVGFMGSAGLAVLVEAQAQAAEQTRLRIVAAGTETLRPLQVTGLIQPLAVYATRDDALSTD